MDPEALTLEILYQRGQSFEDLHEEYCARAEHKLSVKAFREVLQKISDKGFARSRNLRYSISMDGRLVHGMNEKIRKLRRLHEDVFVAVLPSTSTGCAIAQTGTQPDCESRDQEAKKLRVVSVRCGIVVQDQQDLKSGCLVPLWPRMEDSRRRGKEWDFHVCESACESSIRHWWFNVFTTKGSTLATTIYFGPFRDSEQIRGSNGMHPGDIPTISEESLRMAGSQLAKELSPIITALDAKIGWLQAWDLITIFLSDDVRENVFEPAHGQLVEDWLTKLACPNKYFRFIYHVAFALRTILLLVDCIRVMVSDRVRRSVWDFFRNRWS